MRALIPEFIHEQSQRGLNGGEFEAATFMVDISGFTNLTENLLRHRRDGAEVLADVVGEVFSPMVREVHARGGIIPLFAGDAFTAVFPGPEGGELGDSALQALAAAAHIQRHLGGASAGRVFATPYGSFSLQVKIGLSSGLVRWGIPTQGSRCAFYFRGPGIDGAARAEKTSQPGQIVAGPDILPMLVSAVTVEPASAIPWVRVAPLSTMPYPLARPAPAVVREHLAPFVPDAVLDLRLRAEFRDICAVFVSFLEPPDDETLHGFIRAVMQLSQHHGGFFHQVEFGDKGGMLVILFGAPVAFEHMAARAAGMLLALRDEAPPVLWRAGLASGIAWAGFRGGEERWEYGAFGDVMNAAARLATLGDWGDVLCDGPTSRQVEAIYRIAPRGELRLKGKDAAIAVFRIEGTRRWAAREAVSGSMVGRTEELAALLRFIEPLKRRLFAGVMTIHGDAGMGKSRLAQELRLRLEGEGIRWFECPADEILRESLNPFVHLLRRHFQQWSEVNVEERTHRFETGIDRLRKEVLDVAKACPAAAEVARELELRRSFLGALLGLHWENSPYEQIDPKARLANTNASLKAFFLAQSLTGPAVILVEDLHWLDADSWRMLGHLCSHAASYPFALVCTTRPADDHPVMLALPGDVPQPTLELQGLAEEAVRALAEQVLGEPVAPGLLTLLGEQSGGNPFFLEQLVLDLQERGGVRQSSGGTFDLIERAAAIPPTIGEVLVARLDRLAAEVKETVQTAAVLGREFEVAVLSHMLGSGYHVERDLSDAESARVCNAMTEVRYIFRHSLMRDTAYDMQLRARLRDLHALAAQGIRAIHDTDLRAYHADLAFHYRRAGQSEEERRFATLAGDDAASRYANEDALRHYARVLELIAPDDQLGRAEILMALDRIHDLQGQRGPQREILDSLIALVPHLDRGTAIDITLRKSNFHFAISEFTAAREFAEQAITRAAGVDVAREAAAYLRLGKALYSLGHNEEAKIALERSHDLAAAAGERLAAADALMSLGGLYMLMGDFREAEARLVSAQDVFNEIGRPQGQAIALGNLANLARNSGDVPKARAYYRRAFEVFERIGDRRGIALVHLNLAVISGDEADYATGERFLDKAASLFREIGDRQGELLVINNRGDSLERQERFSDASKVYSAGLAISREIGDRKREGLLNLNLGHAYLQTGRFDDARRCFEEASQIARETGACRDAALAELDLGMRLLRIGDPDRAQKPMASALARFRELRSRPSELLALRELSLCSLYLGDHRAARDYAEQCLRGATDLGDRHLQAQAAMSLGYEAELGGRMEEAGSSYEEAFELQRGLQQENAAAEAAARLALVAMMSGDIASARSHVDTVVPHLARGNLDGVALPGEVFLAAYRVLSGLGDPAGMALLDRAVRFIEERASGIADAHERASFLEHVPANREILRAAGVAARKGPAVQE